MLSFFFQRKKSHSVLLACRQPKMWIYFPSVLAAAALINPRHHHNHLPNPGLNCREDHVAQPFARLKILLTSLRPTILQAVLTSSHSIGTTSADAAAKVASSPAMVVVLQAWC